MILLWQTTCKPKPGCLSASATMPMWLPSGKHWRGCAKGAQSAVILTLGTGVGAGVVLGGKLLTGYTGAASEAGHMVIADAPDAPAVYLRAARLP